LEKLLLLPALPMTSARPSRFVLHPRGRLGYVVSNAAINPFMKKDGHGGSIVIVISISAYVSASMQVEYCGTKGAISMLGKVLQPESSKTIYLYDYFPGCSRQKMYAIL
jgi:NAD(P)-dependent dehydrogenase (short-subunit alcohol dehydrogenase family)